MAKKIPQPYYPYWAFKTKREWKRSVRKRWTAFKRGTTGSEVMTGSAFYPKAAYSKLQRIMEDVEKIDAIMKEFYKNA